MHEGLALLYIPQSFYTISDKRFSHKGQKPQNSASMTSSVFSQNKKKTLFLHEQLIAPVEE